MRKKRYIYKMYKQAMIRERCNQHSAYSKTKSQVSFAVTEKLISTYVFATQIVKVHIFLNANFQASSLLLWLYRLVSVGPF